MNEQDSTDKLLDAVAARIRSTPVPDYPGPPVLDSQLAENPVTELSNVRKARHFQFGAICCCAAVLCAVAFTVMTRHRVPDSNVREIAEQSEPSDANIMPIHVQTIDSTLEFDLMIAELDRLSGRLDQLETEVAFLEVRSDLATLLAQYTPLKTDRW